MSDRYFHSEQMLERALKTIPLGTQTFSKSRTQYPYGVSPYYIKCGRGSHVWDIDGNEYVDFINGLAAVTLGYNDPDVTAAVQEQLVEGTIFSLPHPIEVDVAEKIADMVPCAQMVRFGKNGSDATSGAIRLARAYTGRDHIAACGYHGWHDWYIGATTRSRGVPGAVRELTHLFAYNDIESLHAIFRQYPDNVAAVIMEPMNVNYPQDGFLAEVRDLAHRHGALLILDETVTGFRVANGGAQELFSVTPDLATFGKGIANGYPVSAVAGRADIMILLEDVFFSFTFGGEALSLAAAKATLAKLNREPVVDKLASLGRKLLAGVQELVQKHGVGHFIGISGHPAWTFLTIKDTPQYTMWEIKTLFLQEVFARGILTLGTHNLSYAHNDDDICKLLTVYNEVFPLLRDAVDNQRLSNYLRCRPLEPLFKIR